MRPIYTHHRAHRIYSKGKGSSDITVLTDCANKLRHYGYPEHAKQLEAKCKPVAPVIPADTPEVHHAKPSRKRTKKAG